MEQGVCKRCGCTWNNPCYHPDHGPCWWYDEDETLCSHCADPVINKSSETEHCVNTSGKYFAFKTTDYVTKTSLEKELCSLAESISNLIVENPKAFRGYIEERIKALNKQNKRCLPASIWLWDVNTKGEIKCVLASTNYKVVLCFYPIKGTI